MAISRISYHVMAVGQGNGTLAVYYDQNNKPIDVVIMDFGSDTTTQSSSGPIAVLYALSILRAMPKTKIGAIFFSHSDFDHISLMARLLAFFPPGTLPIGGVFFSGDISLYTKGKDPNKTNILQDLVRYLPARRTLTAFPANYSSFAGAAATPITSVQGFPYYILIANAASPRRAKQLDSGNPPKKLQRNAYAVNTESLVIVADSSGHQFVMAGDATAQTLAKINDRIRDHPAAAANLPDVFHATVPHHGSITTTATRRGLGRGGDWDATLQTYVDRLKARSVSVTAGIENEHSHPSAFILQYYWDHVWEQAPYWDNDVTPDGRHFTTQYFDPAKQVGVFDPDLWPPTDEPPGWRTVQTAQAVFTNNYWYAGGTFALPPMPVTPLPFNPARFSPARLPREVHWEISLDLGKSEVEILRHDAKPLLVDLGRALIAGRLEVLSEVPAWEDLRRQAAPHGPAVTHPLGDSSREPTRRRRQRR
jgi:hypothetical protein